MEIGIISDIHDRIDNLARALEVFKREKVELIICCGDWISPFVPPFWIKVMGDMKIPVVGVLGNNDGDVSGLIKKSQESTFPFKISTDPFMELNVVERLVAVTHGHHQGVLEELVASGKYDVVCTGHTHRARNEMSGKTLIINPGSISYVRDGGVVKDASVAVYESEENQARVVEI